MYALYTPAQLGPGVLLGDGNRNQAERYQHEALQEEQDSKTKTRLKMADVKGKASSMNEFAEKNDELRPTILMLMDKYALGSGTVHAVVDETNSRLHWLLEDGKHFVNKNMEGIHWKWLRRGVVPVGEKPAGGKRKLGKLKGKLEDEPLMQLELQSRATRLGARMMMLEHRMPTEFQNMISRLEELEGTGTSHKRVSSVQQTAENHVQADLCREEVRKPNTEVRARRRVSSDSGSAFAEGAGDAGL